MSRVAEVGQRGAVVEVDQRVDQRLRVDDDVDPLVGHAEEVVRLDRLEALVHQRRRVDRDPPAHLPGRVGEGVLDADPGRGRSRPRKGPPRGGQDQLLHACRAPRRRSAGAAPSARSRPAAAAPRSPRPAPSPARRRRTRLSLLARATSIPSVSATTVEPRPAAPTMPLRTRSAPEVAISSRHALLPGQHPPAPGARAPARRPSASARAIVGTPCSRACSTASSQPRPAASPTDLELVGAPDHVQRLRPDRPRRPEYQDLLHARSEDRESTRLL